MSRNLLRTDCDFCSGMVALIEAPRLGTEADFGPYFREYVGMVVADASCLDCDAKYLAWVKDTPTRTTPRTAPKGDFFDLSFRSTFNDEAGGADMPSPQRFARTAEGKAQAAQARFLASLPDDLDTLLPWSEAETLRTAVDLLYRATGIELVPKPPEAP